MKTGAKLTIKANSTNITVMIFGFINKYYNYEDINLYIQFRILKSLNPLSHRIDCGIYAYFKFYFNIQIFYHNN